MASRARACSPDGRGTRSVPAAPSGCAARASIASSRRDVVRSNVVRIPRPTVSPSAARNSASAAAFANTTWPERSSNSIACGTWCNASNADPALSAAPRRRHPTSAARHRCGIRKCAQRSSAASNGPRDHGRKRLIPCCAYAFRQIVSRTPSPGRVDEKMNSYIAVCSSAARETIARVSSTAPTAGLPERPNGLFRWKRRRKVWCASRLTPTAKPSNKPRSTLLITIPPKWQLTLSASSRSRSGHRPGVTAAL